MTQRPITLPAPDILAVPDKPAPALAREPLTYGQIVTEFSRPCYQSEDLFDWFDAGVKFAERHFGITADSARAAASERPEAKGVGS